MQSTVCESMLSDTVAMENQTALRAAWLCSRVWFLETRLLDTVQVPDGFRSTFEKNVIRPEVERVKKHLAKGGSLRLNFFILKMR